MADTFTPSLNLCKPEINQSAQTWGIKLNSDLDLLDAHAAAMKSFQAGNDARINQLIAATIQAVFPRGSIILWSGAIGSIPAGWALCNGGFGTPNLSDRFVLGNGGSRTQGEIGGSFNSGNAVTDTQGGHSHGGVVGTHVLTINEIPVHAHSAWTDVQGSHSHTAFGALVASNPPGMAYGGGMGIIAGNLGTDSQGGHGHNVGIGNAGASWGHDHGITWDYGHAHNVNVSIVPPYYAMAYIMRL